jgi:hypothetical protein
VSADLADCAERGRSYPQITLIVQKEKRKKSVQSVQSADEVVGVGFELKKVKGCGVRIRAFGGWMGFFGGVCQEHEG